ncbi:transposase-like protein [Allocatelliglobosispora scoriae]|uniref:Transposase-like protein n=1 Tax=Allocatelliglobosispora scoriae TaxID=643052 RepID=A0A841BZK9_9ACTN|nr:hypothetical protein [Allocatelliglobosispora scoriae]MBB5874597.1 transposase-like protein [Allocatelliglobosispora scoriae]
MRRTTPPVFATLDTAFAMLTCEPAPLTLDTTAVVGLPDGPLPLGELRALLLGGRTGAAATAQVWKLLAEQARERGSAWTVAAVGVALPALTRITGRLAAGNDRHHDDIASEVLAAFLHALRTEDPDQPRLWQRLCWAAWRAGMRVVQTTECAELPADTDTGSRLPKRPYGHPDLILGRAVAAGILTAGQAELISATRLGDVLVEELAQHHGVSAPAMRMRRRRAELALAAALHRGDLLVPAAR